MTIFNRDDARKLWTDSGLDYSVLTTKNLYKLARLIEENLNKHTEFNMWLNFYKKSCRPYRIYKNPDSYLFKVVFTVNGDYFVKREGITFNQDGFISFAGWASSSNVVPFLEAFKSWVMWLREEATEKTNEKSASKVKP